VPPKTHPRMDFPSLGVTRDDPGKCVLGTVPVAADGSAYFRAPSGVIVFFQALDERGMALQTMRGATHVQPGQTLSCIGCHEPRYAAPAVRPVAAARRAPSRITPAPPGSWPLRFDRLVQPVLDRHCVSCHRPGSGKPGATTIDLTPVGAYETMVGIGKPSARDHVKLRYQRGESVPGKCVARQSALLKMLTASRPHHGVTLDADSRERLVTWLDTYAQRLGSFGERQEKELRHLRREWRDLLAESRN